MGRRRTTVRQRRRALARRRMRPLRRALGNRVHWFREKTELTAITAPPNAFNYGILTFRAADLINWGSSFEQLFDLYKIKKVKFTIIPKFNVSAAEYQNPAAQAGALPLLYIAPNRDPYVPSPVSSADVLNDDGSVCLRMDRPRTFVIHNPKPDITDVTGDRIPMQFNVGVQPWLLTGGNNQPYSQATVQHYGYRWALLNQGPFDVTMQVIAEYTMCFKEQD